MAYLENLEVFDVSNNVNLGSLEGGNLALNPGLPSEIGMLTNLHVLKLDHCGFSGTIPAEIGELRKLEHLLLRGTTAGLQDVTNRFSGTLPTQVREGHLGASCGIGLRERRAGRCQMGHGWSRW